MNSSRLRTGQPKSMAAARPGHRASQGLVRALSLDLALALGLALLLGPAFPARAAGDPTPVLPDGLQLSADVIEHTLDSRALTASGQVDLRLGGLRVQGGQLDADLKRHLAWMRGPVTVTSKDGTLTGTDLAYDWENRRGTLQNADTLNKGFRLSSRLADLSPGDWLLHDSLFTKCTLPTPEYAFHARDLKLDPDRQLVEAHGVSLDLFGHRILPLPDMRFSLADTKVGQLSRDRLPIPTTGYDSSRGLFVAEELPVHLSDQTIVLAGAGYGTLEGTRLTLFGLYAPSPVTTYRVDARYRQHAPEDAATGSTAVAPSDLDGVFEVSTPTRLGHLTTAYEETVDSTTSKDLAYLPRVDLAPPSFRLGSVTVTPALQWAQLVEQASGHASSRTQGQLSWFAAPHLPAPLSLSLSGTARQDWYGTGTTLTTGTLGATLGHPVGGGVVGEARLNSSQVAGTTPFSFDRPDRYVEGETALTWRKEADYASVSAVWDLAGLGTGAGGRNPLGGPVAVKGNATLRSGLWDLNVNARYELGSNPHYSTLTLNLIRRFHCFGVGLTADQVNQTYSLRFVVL